MELSENHLRYLLTIYQLSRENPDVGCVDVAKALHVKKPTVTRMLGVLMEKGVLVRERFSKVYLTDTGFLLARDLERKQALIRERLPALGYAMNEEEQCHAAYQLAVLFREREMDWFQADENKDVSVT